MFNEVANKHAPFKERNILSEQVQHIKKTTKKCYLWEKNAVFAASNIYQILRST